MVLSDPFRGMGAQRNSRQSGNDQRSGPEIKYEGTGIAKDDAPEAQNQGRNQGRGGGLK